jgi:hypothetical protein
MATKRVPQKAIAADLDHCRRRQCPQQADRICSARSRKLERCKRAHGDAQVRLGVRGRAECPNYLIEYVRENAKTHERVTHQDAAYSGSTHRELAPRHIEEARNWSPEEMNITAVSALIGRLRNPNAPSSRFSDED